jgi:hypothetical protein
MKSTTVAFSALVCAFIISSALAAPPPGKGKGGNEDPPASFDPEIGYIYSGKNGDEIRLTTQDGSVEVTAFQTNEKIRSLDLSSDATGLIVFATDQGVFTIPWGAPSGTAPDKIAPAAPNRIEHVDFSPGDDRVLYSTGQNIYIAAIGGDGSSTPLGIQGYNARWSPVAIGNDELEDIFYYGQSSDNWWHDLMRTDEGGSSPVIVVPHEFGEGVNWAAGLDVIPSYGLVDSTAPVIVATYNTEPNGNEFLLRLFTVNGEPTDLNISGTDFHPNCSGNRFVFSLNSGRSNSIAVAEIGGATSVIKKRLGVNPKKDWIPKASCGVGTQTNSQPKIIKF